jgi:hypothetical protein
MGDGHLINAILSSERAIEKARLLEHYLPRLRREAFKRRLPLVSNAVPQRNIYPLVPERRRRTKRPAKLNTKLKLVA